MSLPNADPKFCDSSFIRSTISVALLALILSGGKLSSSNVFLIFMRRSLLTICVRLASPERGKGCKEGPRGPPFELTPITAPGTMLIVWGFKTPSSTAVNTPPILILAFLRVNSTTLFNVLMSGRAYSTGPRPYRSLLAFIYREITQGKDFNSLCTSLKSSSAVITQ